MDNKNNAMDLNQLFVNNVNHNNGKCKNLTKEEHVARRLRLCQKYGVSYFSDIMFDEDDKPYRLPIAACGL